MKSARSHFFLLVLLVLSTIVLVPQGNVLADHSCTGTSEDASTDSKVGHACVGAADSSSASGNGQITTFGGLINRLNQILNTIVPFIVGLAVFIIIWGIFTYITHAEEEEKRQEAKQFVLWGVIGVFLMLSVWGFVNILVNSFSLKKDIPASVPGLPTIPQ